ncbi:hypothetical protein [Burkholderia pseudomallei]|uniref:hypothetical protein n=1 Tax=Burkholderia pseudomallei TaxID=28450 RepID=UPI00050EDE06|nr:hypothetical protein [Burkholderia pseudomallei]KGC47828.1 ricin-type beta-trefoil lectin domain protein [Burkholderia pseudomallei]KGS88962.1 ricin-type beta-trefoil lectin domain protein [Burkholderia pseudomallei MSHR5596]KGX38313.1 ricin-type beta-trefoil lectin domain protein [Burkholderia pseudomallei MSHR3335]
MDRSYRIHLDADHNYVLAAEDSRVGSKIVLQKASDVDSALCVWTLHTKDNTIALTSSGNTVVLDCNALEDESQFVLATYRGSPTETQKWRHDSPYFRNVSKDNFVIDNFGGAMKPGNRIIAYRFNGGDTTQQWFLQPETLAV